MVLQPMRHPFAAAARPATDEQALRRGWHRPVQRGFEVRRA